MDSKLWINVFAAILAAVLVAIFDFLLLYFESFSYYLHQLADLVNISNRHHTSIIVYIES